MAQSNGHPAFEDSKRSQPASWTTALMYAFPITALILILFYYWFAIADRYVIFLYNHDMGPLVPNTGPFSRTTASRYWMAGLVAAGAVLVLHTLANGIAGRCNARYRPPVWWRVWAISTGLLVVGIPAITMTQNQPTLPLWNTAQVVAVTLVGLAGALLPGDLAARKPGTLFFAAIDGWGLMLILTTCNNLDQISGWIARDAWAWVAMIGVVFVGGIGWLMASSFVQHSWRRAPTLDGSTLLLAGLSVAHLLMPLIHHLVGTDGYFYISDSDNFFARNVLMQGIAWALLVWLAYTLADIRRKVKKAQ